MITWMEHPEHGRHPATGGEVEHLLQNGWTVCRRKHPDYQEDEAAPVQGEPAKRGRGRPPKAKG
jgi:hypothetical protein